MKLSPIPEAVELPLPSAEDGRAALARLEPRLAALSPEALVPINLDIARACAVALGAQPAVERLRPAIAQHLPTFPLDEVDGLGDCTLALYYAHLACGPRRRADKALERVYREVLALRAHLLFQAEALARAGYFDLERVVAIRRGSGYLDMANDLVSLSLMFRERWAVVASKTPVERAECERADVLGRDLLARMGRRLQPNGGDPAQHLANPRESGRDLRARCFTLFVRTYDLCRQAAVHIRWRQGDADEWVPSLYAARMRGATKREVRPK